MKAAVVTSFGSPPRYADFPAPAAAGQHEMAEQTLIDVRRSVVLPPDTDAVAVAAGRDAGRLALLPELGADVTVSLAGPDDDAAARLADSAADVDVVLDYLWGEPAAAAMAALVTARSDRGKTLSCVSIGSVAGVPRRCRRWPGRSPPGP
jgi:D-arabinose 1-dehydrogenase-like Zn-dependent alcohol dehydrogenase